MIRNKLIKFYLYICLIFELHLKIENREPDECRGSILYIGKGCDHSTDDQIGRIQVLTRYSREKFSRKVKVHGKVFIPGTVNKIIRNSSYTTTTRTDDNENAY